MVIISNLSESNQVSDLLITMLITASLAPNAEALLTPNAQTNSFVI